MAELPKHQILIDPQYAGSPRCKVCCQHCLRLESDTKYKLCSQCGIVWYCSRECQVEHWEIHREKCEPAPKKESRQVKRHLQHLRLHCSQIAPLFLPIWAILVSGCEDPTDWMLYVRMTN